MALSTAMTAALVHKARALQHSDTMPVVPVTNGLIEHLVAVEEGEEDQEEAPLPGASRAQAAMLGLAQRASKKLLDLMTITRVHLRFWEKALQKPYGQRRLLVVRAGSRSFLRHAFR